MNPPPDAWAETPGDTPVPLGRPVYVRLTNAGPTVTYTILGLTACVFILQLLSEYVLGDGLDYPALLGMKVNSLIVQGELWRLFTPMLLHGSLLHIGVNMYALYSFGPELERYYGHVRFLALYLLAGFAGNVLSFCLSAAASLGASTAIFGLLGAEAVFLYRNRQFFGENARRALTNLVMVALVNFMIGMTGGIDNWGHLGGLSGGCLFAWSGGPLLEVKAEQGQLYLVDTHNTPRVLVAVVMTGLVFALLAGVGIWLRS